MAGKIEFTGNNVKPFVAWLKRFSIDNSLLIEIDEDNEYFIAKSYDEERSIVKYSKIKFSEAGFNFKKSKSPTYIKIGFYHIPRFIKVLDLFGSNDFSFIITYDKLKTDKSEEDVGTLVTLKNKSLKMNIEASSLTIFNYISDELFLNRVCKIDLITTFKMSTKTKEKIDNLCDLDTECKLLKFSKKDNSIYASGITFKYEINDNDEAVATGDINVFKEKFGLLDDENYDVELGEDKVIFRSEDSDTISVLSLVEDNTTPMFKDI